MKRMFRISILISIFIMTLAITSFAGEVLVHDGDNIVLKDGNTYIVDTKATATLVGNGIVLSNTTIMANEEVVLTLKNVNIDVRKKKETALSFQGKNNNLILSGSNILKSGKNAGISVIENTELIISSAENEEVTGSLEAVGGKRSSGIGGAGWTAGGIITIKSGTIKAVGDSMGSGIGGGYKASGGILTIEGGSIDAIGGDCAPGIGGGSGASGGIITIKGGTVHASGGVLASGIGGGNKGSGGIITIEGGFISSVGGEDGAGIGGGNVGSGGIITITGGHLDIAGGTFASGIGGGNDATGGTITISGGFVDVISGEEGTGIGGGTYGSAGQIEISGDAIVYADGGRTDIGDGYQNIGKGNFTIIGDDAHVFLSNGNCMTPKLLESNIKLVEDENEISNRQKYLVSQELLEKEFVTVKKAYYFVD